MLFSIHETTLIRDQLTIRFSFSSSVYVICLQVSYIVYDS